MGDVGSGYLGFVFAVMGLATGIHEPTAPWTLLILAGVFAVDATFTVIRRFLRRARLTQPHRTHGFQLLARKMGHQRVTLSIALVNLVWLLPCAIASVLWPQYAAWIVPLAFAPLALAAFAIGAGRPEVEAPAPRAVVIPFVAAQANLKRRPAAPAHEHHGIRAAQQYSPAPAAIERSTNESG